MYVAKLGWSHDSSAVIRLCVNSQFTVFMVIFISIIRPASHAWHSSPWYLLRKHVVMEWHILKFALLPCEFLVATNCSLPRQPLILTIFVHLLLYLIYSDLLLWRDCAYRKSITKRVICYIDTKHEGCVTMLQFMSIRKVLLDQEFCIATRIGQSCQATCEMLWQGKRTVMDSHVSYLFLFSYLYLYSFTSSPIAASRLYFL